MLLHRFEQGGLRLGRSAVDFIGKYEVREKRSAHEDERPPARVRIVLQYVRTGDIRGHQVGSELDTLERQAQNLRKCADEQRFRQAGHADEQAMPLAEYGDEQLLDDLLLTDDDLADLSFQRL